MGYSYKNINKNSVNKSKRNDSSYKDARQIFAEMIKVALERKYKFYYVDEVVFTLNDLPKKDWKNLNFNKE
jgi:ATP:corrinoid adenosyltransferase